MQSGFLAFPDVCSQIQEFLFYISNTPDIVYIGAHRASELTNVAEVTYRHQLIKSK